MSVEKNNLNLNQGQETKNNLGQLIWLTLVSVIIFCGTFFGFRVLLIDKLPMVNYLAEHKKADAPVPVLKKTTFDLIKERFFVPLMVLFTFAITVIAVYKIFKKITKKKESSKNNNIFIKDILIRTFCYIEHTQMNLGFDQNFCGEFFDDCRTLIMEAGDLPILAKLNRYCSYFPGIGLNNNGLWLVYNNVFLRHTDKVIYQLPLATAEKRILKSVLKNNVVIDVKEFSPFFDNQKLAEPIIGRFFFQNIAFYNFCQELIVTLFLFFYVLLKEHNSNITTAEDLFSLADKQLNQDTQKLKNYYLFLQTYVQNGYKGYDSKPYKNAFLNYDYYQCIDKKEWVGNGAGSIRTYYWVLCQIVQEYDKSNSKKEELSINGEDKEEDSNLINNINNE